MHKTRPVLTMLFRILLVCIFVSAGSAVRCMWIDHQYGPLRDSSLRLLNTMMISINSTEDAEHEHAMAFPNMLYRRAAKAPAEERLSFVTQVLDEIKTLFEEDQTSVSWDESAVDNFLSVVTQQADGLRTCVPSHFHKKKNKLSKYFKRLSRHVLKQKGHSAEAWDLICKVVKLHLYRADTLVSAVHKFN